MAEHNSASLTPGIAARELDGRPDAPSVAAMARPGTYFVLSRDFPRRLEFRNGTVLLETIHKWHSPTHDEWILQAKNVATGACCPILKSPLGRYGFDLSLHVEGFYLDEHTQAGRVMKALEKLGHARMRYGKL